MPRSLPREAFDSLALVARLPVAEDRAELVRSTVEFAHALIGKLDELDLGETAPATAFNARWE
jgi:hypothetical protein